MLGRRVLVEYQLFLSVARKSGLREARQPTHIIFLELSTLHHLHVLQSLPLTFILYCQWYLL